MSDLTDEAHKNFSERRVSSNSYSSNIPSADPFIVYSQFQGYYNDNLLLKIGELGQSNASYVEEVVSTINESSSGTQTYGMDFNKNGATEKALVNTSYGKSGTTNSKTTTSYSADSNGISKTIIIEGSSNQTQSNSLELLGYSVINNVSSSSNYRSTRNERYIGSSLDSSTLTINVDTNTNSGTIKRPYFLLIDSRINLLVFIEKTINESSEQTDRFKVVKNGATLIDEPIVNLSTISLDINKRELPNYITKYQEKPIVVLEQRSGVEFNSTTRLFDNEDWFAFELVIPKYVDGQLDVNEEEYHRYFIKNSVVQLLESLLVDMSEYPDGGIGVKPNTKPIRYYPFGSI